MRFWSTNSENNTHGHNGELWYLEVLFTDSEEEAIAECRRFDASKLPSTRELDEYYKTHRWRE